MHRVGDRVLTNKCVDGSPRKGTISHVDRDGLLYVSLDYLEAYDSGSSDVAFEENEVTLIIHEVNYG